MNGQLLGDIRLLLARRQPALAYLVALSVGGLASDILVAGTAHQLSSFSAFARREFDADVVWRASATLGHASVLLWVVLPLTTVGSAVLAGWLRACYLIALGEGRYSLQAARRTIVALTLYWLLIELLDLGLAALADHGQAGAALLIQIATTPVWLYVEYAIVFDDVSLVEGVRRSLRMFQVRTRASILAVLALFMISALAVIAFDHGFTDSTHVEPTYLVAWELVGALILFATDVVLLTLYRRTRLSVDGSAGSSEAPSPPAPSD